MVTAAVTTGTTSRIAEAATTKGSTAGAITSLGSVGWFTVMYSDWCVSSQSLIPSSAHSDAAVGYVALHMKPMVQRIWNRSGRSSARKNAMLSCQLVTNASLSSFQFLGACSPSS